MATILDWHTRAPVEVTQDDSSRRVHINLDGHGAAELLGENAAHELRQCLTCFVQDESSRRVRPRQLETRGQRRDPDLADRRVWADDESGFIRVLEQDLELSAAAFDFESARITNFLQAPE